MATSELTALVSLCTTEEDVAMLRRLSAKGMAKINADILRGVDMKGTFDELRIAHRHWRTELEALRLRSSDESQVSASAKFLLGRTRRPPSMWVLEMLLAGQLEKRQMAMLDQLVRRGEPMDDALEDVAFDFQCRKVMSAATAELATLPQASAAASTTCCTKSDVSSLGVTVAADLVPAVPQKEADVVHHVPANIPVKIALSPEAADAELSKTLLLPNQRRARKVSVVLPLEKLLENDVTEEVTDAKRCGSRPKFHSPRAAAPSADGASPVATFAAVSISLSSLTPTTASSCAENSNLTLVRKAAAPESSSKLDVASKSGRTTANKVSVPLYSSSAWFVEDAEFVK